MILSNKARCLLCENIIESKTTHDYQTCECDNLAVDGGLEYLKRNFKEKNSWEELSEVKEEEK